MVQQLNDKVILVTGAASGIGLDFVHRAVEDGAIIVAIDRDERALKNVQKTIELPERILTVPADVTQSSQIAQAVQEAVRNYGRIDGCFNNAGVASPIMAIPDISEEDFRRVMDVNAIGSFLVLKHVLSVMRDQGYGAVVNTGSILGYRGTSNYSAYCASKHAVLGLTRVAALEAASYGVRVNAVSPGLIDTPMNVEFHQAVNAADPLSVKTAISSKIPLGRYATPREVGAAVSYLLSDSASYITGAVLDVDGGLSTGF